jgi:hypothetical protein
MEGDGLGLAVAQARAKPMVASAANFSRARRCMAVTLCFGRHNIVGRYALETGSEQAFVIDEKVAHHCFGRPDNAAFDFAGRPGKLDLEDRLNHWLAHLGYYMVS